MSDEVQSSFDIGKKLFEQKNYGEAVSAFAKAVRLAPDNSEYKIWLSRALRLDNELEKAIDEASKALQLDPKSSPAYRARANAQAMLKKYNEALRDISQAIELDPNNSGNFATRRKIFHDTEDWQNYIYDTMHYYDLKGEIDLYEVRQRKRQRN